MYRLLLILILTLSFQSWTKADDIRDFEIEGMSVGDNALDFFTKYEIDNFDKFTYPDKKFSEVFTGSSKFEIYDSVTITLKPRKYRIYGISGAMDYREKSFNECLAAKKIIVTEVQSIFINSKKVDNGTYQTPDYTDNKSRRSQVEIILDKSNEVISVDCVDWSAKTEKKHGWGDNLNITIYSKELENFLRNQ